MIRSHRPRPIAAVAAVVLLLGACAHRGRDAAVPWPTEIREYVIPDTLAFPNDLAVDATGAVWYTDRAGSRIGRLDPETGEFRQYATPTPRGAPYGIEVAADGGVWYAASRGSVLGRLDPATGEIREYPIKEAAGGPHDLVVRGERVWFTVRRGGAYGWLDARTGEVRLFEFPIPDGYTPVDRGPYALAAGERGPLWFTAMGESALYRVSEEDGSMTRVALPDGGWPRRLTVDVEGRVWYTNFPRSRIGRLDPRTGEIVELPLLATPADPYGIAAGPDGRIWFNEARNGVITGHDARVGGRRSIAIPTRGAAARGMAVDAARRRVWLPLSGTHRIGRIDLPL